MVINFLHFWIMMRCFLVFVVILIGPVQVSSAAAMAKRLIRDLFSDYSTDVRPRINYSQTVPVELFFKLNQIQNVDEVSMVLQMHGFLIAHWHDDFLKWNASDYDGISHLSVHPEKVWLPDFGIDNSAESFYPESFSKEFWVTIYSDGEIHWAFGGSFRTMCELDLTYFPFDSQKCDLKVMNWAYQEDAVNLRHGHSKIIVKDDFHQNGVWLFVGSDVKHSYNNHDLDHKSRYLFPEVTFTLYLKRKPRYYVTSLLLPCLLILCIALAGFWMPPESGEKVTLGISILLAYVVFQIVINSSTPQSSDHLPVIGIYVLFVMSLMTISTITSIVVLFFHHKEGSHPVPAWAKKFFLQKVSRVLCIHSVSPEIGDQCSSRVSDRTVENGVSKLNKMSSPAVEEDGGIPSSLQNHFKDHLEDMSSRLRYLQQYVVAKEAEESIKDDWKHLALVIDKLLFWICLVISVIAVPYLITSEQRSPI